METALAREIEDLHGRCGIYTHPEMVQRILDSVGWHERHDLSSSTLLEPAAGDGVFLVEAAKRLLNSFKRHSCPVETSTLVPRILAYEIAPTEAQTARRGIVHCLQGAGVHPDTAEACAREWVRTADFLLAHLPSRTFTHVVANPPYVRWSNLPKRMRARYGKVLPPSMTGGDLFVPFLDRALEALKAGGRCGFLCSDRWRYMAFAEGFRKRWLPLLDIAEECSVKAGEAYQEEVGAYPSLLVATKRKSPRRPEPRGRSKKGCTLADLGCRIRVGPALGYAKAFVLAEGEGDVEPGLLAPWVAASEIMEGVVDWSGRHVIVMNGDDGCLRDLARYPLLRARLERHKPALSRRAIVRRSRAPWFRPIDCVRASDWAAPKLLVPELSRVPRLAVDRSGAIPSHGVYAIFPPEDQLDALYERLRDGRLAAALEGIAPKVNNGYVRCYKRFLSMIRLPA